MHANYLYSFLALTVFTACAVGDIVTPAPCVVIGGIIVAPLVTSLGDPPVCLVLLAVFEAVTQCKLLITTQHPASRTLTCIYK